MRLVGVLVAVLVVAVVLLKWGLGILVHLPLLKCLVCVQIGLLILVLLVLLVLVRACL